ncbi:glycosyltransferase family 4 protein [Coraliomargarita akajimensis]|uniref:Glycosyl transferase group 1 n=1 Tax=Coraliomargarita akajimensis (strain DSM 45221 / IAM 15411 / JCM 23193 / KCTC 12865 / 04OKA010-24) TaxID=583355 RepID=D5EKJ6_CORAD|nr:glycosyltransferase family 1 protein [Coraliomargarita akajimensis]ADE54903.1 glycosyl transferase group 1 [Coraliomargarita akajimensis DSM 45221]
MKLCIVTETYPPEVNGVAMTLYRISEGLRKQGHKVSIVRPRQSSEAQNARYDAETIVPGLPLPGYDGLRFGLPCRQTLRKLWKAEAPDIIYAATEGPLGQSAIRAAEDLGIPITSGFHTNFHEYMKHYKLPILEKMVGGFLKKTHNRTRRTFAPSQDVINRLNEMGIQDTRLLGRGVDTELFNPQRRDPKLRQRWGVDPDRGVVAIFVSRLAAEKNIPLAAKAFAHVRARHPDVACVFVGDGPERVKLEKKHPDFIFAGMQKGEDLARHYASGDIFVFPSITETFGNVVTEAMASGLVTLAYDYAAPRRFIRDGVNGYVADFNNEAAFMRRLEDALHQREHWTTVREAARATAETLDWDSIIQGFANELESAIEDSASQ